ncbi:MAG: hypothetical protein FWE51_04455 [Coriobacteriia bacterium]|nr:hypothetical protein [Coriobacteriia bacterium]
MVARSMAASHYEVDQEYQVIVDPSVYDRMFHHFMFLAEVDVDAARKLEQDMVATLRSLSFLPQRHPYYDNPHMPAKRYRAAQVSNYHRIIFVVEVDKVYVDNIIDSCSQ